MAFAQAILNGLFDNLDSQKQPEYIALLENMKIIDIGMVTSQNISTLKKLMCIFLIENLNNDLKAQQEGNSNSNSHQILNHKTLRIIAEEFSNGNLNSGPELPSQIVNLFSQSNIFLNITTLKFLAQAIQNDKFSNTPKTLIQVINLFSKNINFKILESLMQSISENKFQNAPEAISEILNLFLNNDIKPDDKMLQQLAVAIAKHKIIDGRLIKMLALFESKYIDNQKLTLIAKAFENEKISLYPGTIMQITNILTYNNNLLDIEILKPLITAFKNTKFEKFDEEELQKIIALFENPNINITEILTLITQAIPESNLDTNKSVLAKVLNSLKLRQQN